MDRPDRNVPRSRRPITASALLAATLALVVPAASRAGDAPGLPVSTTVRTRILAADTGQPLAGTMAYVERRVTCTTPQGTARDTLPPIEGRADAKGWLTLHLPVLWAECYGSGQRVESITLLAPGYRLGAGGSMNRAVTSDPPLRREYRLEPVRYLSEQTAILQEITRPRYQGGSAWTAAVRTVQEAVTRPVDGPGVFVRAPGRRLERLAAMRRGLMPKQEWGDPIMVAQDAGGTIHAWDGDGKPFVPPRDLGSTRILPGRTDEPAILRATELLWPLRQQAVLWDLRPDRWGAAPAPGHPTAVALDHDTVLSLEDDGRTFATYTVNRARELWAQGSVAPGPRVPVASVLAGARRVVCMTEYMGQAPEGNPILAVVLEAADGFRLMLVERSTDGATWRAVGLPWVGRAVRACSAIEVHRGRKEFAVYLAPPEGGLEWVEVVLDGATDATEAWPWKATAYRLASGDLALDRRRFVSLAAVPVESGEEHRLYAVAGDDAVYRFTPGLQPDRRLVIELGRTK